MRTSKKAHFKPPQKLAHKFLMSPKKLYVTMVIYIFISLILAYSTALLFNLGITALAAIVTEQKSHYQERLQSTVDDLQAYITDNDITVANNETLADWVNENWYIYFSIYDSGHTYYDSLHSLSGFTFSPDNELDAGLKVDFFDSEYGKNLPAQFYLKFGERTLNLRIRAFYRLKFETMFSNISVSVGAVSFIVFFLLLFRRKLLYIHKIEEGINVIEGGSLEYRIAVKGRDELASLSQSINQMSETLNEQMLSRENMQQENAEIISSISHDIRTPLTSVICYLDLLSNKKFETAEQMNSYIEKAKTNAYQIKSLTDNLFAHTRCQGHILQTHMEKVNGNFLIEQYVFDCQTLLQEKGFTVEIDNKAVFSYTLEADVLELKRVFDNLCSNVIKYADEKIPIVVTLFLQNNRLVIIQKNHINVTQREVESNGIGIKTAKRIIEQHGGRMTTQNDGEEYSVEVSLPMNFG